MKRRTSKVREYKQPIRPNIGVIVFAFIFIYILIYVLRYAYSDRIAIYEVIRSNISENNEFKGIVLRDETVVNAKEAGYVTFYVSGASRVAKNDMVFSIDEGANNTKVEKNTKVDIKKNDYLAIADEMDYFRDRYSDSHFELSYSFCNEITNMVLELSTGALYDNMEEAIKQSNTKNIVVDKTKDAGIISYTTDGMENKTEKDISDKLFDSHNYTYVSNISGTLLQKGAPVYKRVASDTWKIAFKLNKSQYKALKEKNTIGVTLGKDNLVTNAKVRTLEKNGSFYGILTLNDYMVNYIDDRYIDIKLAMNTAEGLKIPNSSIVEKDFYVVPKNMFTKGGNTDSEGLITREYSKDGKIKTKFTETTIYGEKDNKYYIEQSLFEMGTKVVVPGSDKEYELNNLDSLQGVYCVNKGYTEFKTIKVVYSSDEYTIVEENSDSDRAISKYDHIVFDVNNKTEDKIIF